MAQPESVSLGGVTPPSAALVLQIPSMQEWPLWHVTQTAPFTPQLAAVEATHAPA